MLRTKIHAPGVMAVVTLAIAAACAASAPAAGYNNRGAAAAAARQRTIAVLQAQLAEARQVLAAAQAEMAQARQDRRVENARRERQELAGIRQVRGAQFASNLDQIEADLIEKAGPDSEIGKARAEFLAAEDEHATAKKNVLNNA